MSYVGIDYGRGLTNIDHKKGIRYGVIAMHEVVEAWCDVSEPYYSQKHPDEFDEPDFWQYRKEGYKIVSTDSFDLFITKSKFYTKCAFCSPCAPGAGDIMAERLDGIKAYCLGHDWFDGGKAPYKVYRVKNNKEVSP